MSSFFDVVFHRRSVRSFTAAPVTEAELDRLLRAAMAAPSAKNEQPWEFVVVTDRGILDGLADELPFAKMAHEAPMGIVVCADPSQAHQGKAEYALIDASCAAENLLLAAEALGLGAVWTALHPQPDREEVARRFLGIPESVIPLAFIPVGRAKSEGKALNKFKESKIHRGRW